MTKPNEELEEYISQLKERKIKFSKIPAKYKNTYEVSLIACTLDYKNLESVKREFKDDRAFGLECVKASGYALKYLAPELRDDEEILREAIKTSPFSIIFSSIRLFKDRNLALSALDHGCSLAYLEKHKDDEEIVLKALKQSGQDLSYASDRLKNNKKIVLLAVEKDPEAIRYASPSIQKMCEGNSPELVLRSYFAKKEAQKLEESLNNATASKPRSHKI